MGETIKERTIAFVKSKGITMKKFEQACGLSSGYVTSMRKGFGQEKLESVLNAFPELNRDWLLYGDGMMTNSIHNGIPKETISRALGHSTSTVTDIYINYNNRSVDEANRKVIDFINNL